jgi:hypothetical protein
MHWIKLAEDEFWEDKSEEFKQGWLAALALKDSQLELETVFLDPETAFSSKPFYFKYVKTEVKKNG